MKFLKPLALSAIILLATSPVFAAEKPPLPLVLLENNLAYLNNTNSVVASFFPEWGIYERNFPVANIPAQNLTHILYAFIAICGPNEALRQAYYPGWLVLQEECADQADNTVTIYDRWAAIDIPFDGDHPSDPIKGNFGQLMRLKAAKPDIKILPSFGGWTLSDPFYTLANNATHRQTFVNSVIAFLKEYSLFDGVDIDWEYPGGGGANPDLGSPDDYEAYADLMHDLRQALDGLEQETGRSYLLTSAVGAGPDKINAVNYQRAAQYLDYVFAMTYDFYGAWNGELGHHAALYAAAEQKHVGFDGASGITNLINAGVPASKLVLGVAKYGRGWINVSGVNPDESPFINGVGGGPHPGTWESGNLDYRDIANNYLSSDEQGKNGYTYFYDEQAQAPYLWNANSQRLITYDNKRSAKAKGQYAIDHNLAGLFSWEIDADNGDILNSMHEGLGHPRDDLISLTIEAATGGGKLIIMAKPSKGWEFKEWAGDCKGNNNKPAKTVVKMNKDKRCATVFEPEQFFAEAANPELLPATVKKTSDWETGFCADVIVNNNTDHTVDWVTKFEPGGTINNLWSASYKLLPNGKIRAEGLDWNNEVASGQSVTFGYCADKDGDSELCVGYADIQPAKRSFPQHVSYAANTIHPTNFTQDQQDQHVRDFYDYWKSSYLLSAGTDTNGKSLCRVAFGKSGSNQDITVSEGQGYGMMITALMAGHDPNAQSLFNSLWYFSRKYPSGIDERLMSWKIENGEIVEGNDSAFDGDVDIAYGLLLADAQWGSSGEVNYRNEATTVIQGILESTIGPDSRLPMLGDWVQANGSPYNQYTPRSSDFMPAHFRSFGRATNNPVWDTVITNSQAVIDTIQANYSTGLLPDFIINCNDVSQCVPANSGFLEGAHDGHYYYNAGRDPWRIGLDALLNDDAKSRDQVQKMVTWLANDSGGNANGIKAGYELNGTPIGSYFTTFFAAPFGVATMLDSNQQAFLNDIYAHVYNKQEDYYEDSVNLLSLLVMSGNLWEPVALPTSSLTIEAPTGGGKFIIMAKPSKGWEFKEWAGDCKGNNKKPAKTVVKMDKDQYCTAVFEPK
jgi:chitinase